MTHSCTTKPNNQSLFWSAATADSEIDFEHLRWLHTTFPLHYSADDKRGRQVDPSDPLRAHILLNTEPDYPREHKHTQAHTQCGLEGNESKKQITRPLACGLGQVGFSPPIPPGLCVFVKRKLNVTLSKMTLKQCSFICREIDGGHKIDGVYGPYI